MQCKYLLSVLFLCGLSLHGQQTGVTGRITGVTLYPALATVTRVAEVTLEAGERTVVFKGLPVQTVEDSAFAFVEGGSGAVVLDTGVRKLVQTPVPGPEEKRLQDDLEAVNREIAEVLGRRDILLRREDFLKNLQVASVTDINNKIKIREISTLEWDKLYAYIFDKLAQVADAKRTVDDQLKVLGKRKDAIQVDIANLDKKARREVVSAAVTLRIARAGVYRVRLEYQVGGAGWQPGYEVRLAQDGKTAEVAYFATVGQATGEDWSGVKLALSTAAAARWQQMPSLVPWLLSIWERPLYWGYRDRMSKSRADGMTGGAGAPASPPKEEDKRKPFDSVATTRVVSGSISVTFEVPGLSTVKSGREQVRKVLQVKEMPVTLAYQAHPVYAEKIFTEGEISNDGPLHLLPGKVRVFRDGIQIGNTSLGDVGPGGKFKLFFGNDPTIVTKKELVEKKTDPGRDNEIDYSYRLTVHNTGSAAREVTLHDALPASQNTRIEVSVKEMGRKPDTQDKQGLCTWKLQLAPGEKVSFVYRVRVEYPSKSVIQGLR